MTTINRVNSQFPHHFVWTKSAHISNCCNRLWHTYGTYGKFQIFEVFHQTRLRNYKIKNSIRDARTPEPGEIFFNTMRYRSSVTVQSSRYFQSSVSYIKVQIMLK